MLFRFVVVFAYVLFRFLIVFAYVLFRFVVVFAYVLFRFLIASESSDTHWRQSCLFTHMSPPLQLRQDDVVAGQLTLSKLPDNPRGLEIFVEIDADVTGTKPRSSIHFCMSPEPFTPFQPSQS